MMLEIGLPLESGVQICVGVQLVGVRVDVLVMTHLPRNSNQNLADLMQNCRKQHGF